MNLGAISAVGPFTADEERRLSPHPMRTLPTHSCISFGALTTHRTGTVAADYGDTDFPVPQFRDLNDFNHRLARDEFISDQ